MTENSKEKSFGIPLPSDFSKEEEPKGPAAPRRDSPPPSPPDFDFRPTPPDYNQDNISAPTSDVQGKPGTSATKFRNLLRDGYRYLLQTSAIANQIDVPKNVAFFVNHISTLEPGGTLELEPLYNHISTQGMNHDQIKELLRFFKSKEHRFNVSMSLPLSLQEQDTDAISQILSGTSAGQRQKNTKRPVRKKAMPTPTNAGLPLSRMPKAYTDENVIPGSTDYLKDLGVNPDAKFEISAEGQAFLDDEQTDTSPTLPNAKAPPVQSNAKAKNDSQTKVKTKTKAKAKAKTKAKPPQKDQKLKKRKRKKKNFDINLFTPMGLGFAVAIIPVLLLSTIKYREGAGDPIAVARYALLFIGALGCYAIAQKENPLSFFKSLKFKIAPFWTIIGIVAGGAISYTGGLAPVENVGAYIFSGILGAFFTVIFFGGFLASTIAEVDDSPMVPGFLTALVFGFYTLSYPWLRNLEGMALWYWVANMTVFVGFPIGFLRGRTGSLVPSFCFYLALSIAPGVLPLLGVK